MKNAIKITTLALGLLGIVAGAKAQSTNAAKDSTGVILSIGADGGFSAGSFKNANKWNVGGSVQADIPVAQSFYFTANAGYLDFIGRNDVDGSGFNAPDIHLLPVKAGLKYFPLSYLYVQADAGAAFALNKSTVGYDKTTAFIYSPQVGVLLPLGGKNYIDAAALYEASTKYDTNVNSSKVNFFGVRIAYAFSLK